MDDLAESIDEDEISGKWWMRVFKNINESVDSTTSQADKVRYVVQERDPQTAHWAVPSPLFGLSYFFHWPAFRPTFRPTWIPTPASDNGISFRKISKSSR